jgi:hypothetical protein
VWKTVLVQCEIDLVSIENKIQENEAEIKQVVLEEARSLTSYQSEIVVEFESKGMEQLKYVTRIVK